MHDKREKKNVQMHFIYVLPFFCIQLLYTILYFHSVSTFSLSSDSRRKTIHLFHTRDIFHDPFSCSVTLSFPRPLGVFFVLFFELQKKMHFALSEVRHRCHHCDSRILKHIRLFYFGLHQMHFVTKVRWICREIGLRLWKE